VYSLLVVPALLNRLKQLQSTHSDGSVVARKTADFHAIGSQSTPGTMSITRTTPSSSGHQSTSGTHYTPRLPSLLIVNSPVTPTSTNLVQPTFRNENVDSPAAEEYEAKFQVLFTYSIDGDQGYYCSVKLSLYCFVIA